MIRRRRKIIQARRDQQQMQNEVHALPDPDAADFPEDDNHLFHQVTTSSVERAVNFGHILLKTESTLFH